MERWWVSTTWHFNLLRLRSLRSRHQTTHSVSTPSLELMIAQCQLMSKADAERRSGVRCITASIQPEMGRSGRRGRHFPLHGISDDNMVRHQWLDIGVQDTYPFVWEVAKTIQPKTWRGSADTAQLLAGESLYLQWIFSSEPS